MNSSKIISASYVFDLNFFSVLHFTSITSQYIFAIGTFRALSTVFLVFNRTSMNTMHSVLSWQKGQENSKHRSIARSPSFCAYFYCDFFIYVGVLPELH